MLHRISAVLITRESDYPTDVGIDYSFFDEVLIQTNCPNVLRRFELAVQAKSDIIYIQDDDILMKAWQLWPHYDGKLTHAINEFHRKNYEGTGVTLIGFGCFFPRLMAEIFLDLSPIWRKQFGDDVFVMEADRFFTFSNQPHNSVIMPIQELQRPVRMCSRPGHYALRDQIISQLNHA